MVRYGQDELQNASREEFIVRYNEINEYYDRLNNYRIYLIQTQVDVDVVLSELQTGRKYIAMDEHERLRLEKARRLGTEDLLRIKTRAENKYKESEYEMKKVENAKSHADAIAYVYGVKRKKYSSVWLLYGVSTIPGVHPLDLQ